MNYEQLAHIMPRLAPRSLTFEKKPTTNSGDDEPLKNATTYLTLYTAVICLSSSALAESADPNAWGRQAEATNFFVQEEGHVENAVRPDLTINDADADYPEAAGRRRLPPWQSSQWCWQLLPEGLIYHSYQAGPREPRMALHAISNETASGAENLWDVTLGGRRGVLRFGDRDPFSPLGWQLDIEGAAILRLNLDEQRDVESSDFRFGVPLTYGGNTSQYKVGYYHLSSHLGDEYIERSGFNSRINYVRDCIIVGASHTPTPSWRVYAETAWAFYTGGGAEPWEFQFGAEYSRPGPTGLYGTPFFASNVHLREENDFGLDWTLQSGWLWRGESSSTFRAGLHYLKGKSPQYQFLGQTEEQIGGGIWYDF